MCELAYKWISDDRGLNTTIDIDELNRQIEGGYIQTVRKSKRQNGLISQRLIVLKKGVYYFNGSPSWWRMYNGHNEI